MVQTETVIFVSSAQPRETLRFEGNRINFFPRDQSLSDLLYSWNYDALNLVGQHSRVTVHCYPFAVFPLRDFGGKHLHC